jgi:hypothetical protein
MHKELVTVLPSSTVHEAALKFIGLEEAFAKR